MERLTLTQSEWPAFYDANAEEFDGVSMHTAMQVAMSDFGLQMGGGAAPHIMVRVIKEDRAALLAKFAANVPDWIIAVLANERPLNTLVTVAPVHNFETGKDNVTLGTVGTSLGAYRIPTTGER